MKNKFKTIFKNLKLPLSLIAILICLNSCATSKSKKLLDQKISEESSVNSRSELQTKAINYIDNSVNLTAEQKIKLNELRSSVTRQTDVFNKQSLELRSVLLKDLLSNKYNSQEVALIKNRMRKLEEQRLTMIFDSVDKANIILGREAAANDRVMREFFEDRNYND